MEYHQSEESLATGDEFFSEHGASEEGSSAREGSFWADNESLRDLAKLSDSLDFQVKVTPEELVKEAFEWNLESDVRLMLCIQQQNDQITEMLSMHCEKLKDLKSKCIRTDIEIQDAFNSLNALSNKQFIESRVYEDDKEVKELEEASGGASEGGGELPSAERARQLYAKAIDYGAATVAAAYEPIYVPSRRVAEDVEMGEEQRLDESGVQGYLPRDPYVHRKLPPLIGSKEFHECDEASLLGIEFEEDEESLISDADYHEEADTVLSDVASSDMSWVSVTGNGAIVETSNEHSRSRNVSGSSSTGKGSDPIAKASRKRSTSRTRKSSMASEYSTGSYSSNKETLTAPKESRKAVDSIADEILSRAKKSGGDGDLPGELHGSENKEQAGKKHGKGVESDMLMNLENAPDADMFDVFVTKGKENEMSAQKAMQSAKIPDLFSDLNLKASGSTSLFDGPPAYSRRFSDLFGDHFDSKDGPEEEKIQKETARSTEVGKYERPKQTSTPLGLDATMEHSASVPPDLGNANTTAIENVKRVTSASSAKKSMIASTLFGDSDESEGEVDFFASGSRKTLIGNPTKSLFGDSENEDAGKDNGLFNSLSAFKGDKGKGLIKKGGLFESSGSESEDFLDIGEQVKEDIVKVVADVKHKRTKEAENINRAPVTTEDTPVKPNSVNLRDSGTNGGELIDVVSSSAEKEKSGDEGLKEIKSGDGALVDASSDVEIAIRSGEREVPRERLSIPSSKIAGANQSEKEKEATPTVNLENKKKAGNNVSFSKSSLFDDDSDKERNDLPVKKNVFAAETKSKTVLSKQASLFDDSDDSDESNSLKNIFGKGASQPKQNDSLKSKSAREKSLFDDDSSEHDVVQLNQTIEVTSRMRLAGEETDSKSILPSASNDDPLFRGRDDAGTKKESAPLKPASENDTTSKGQSQVKALQSALKINVGALSQPGMPPKASETVDKNKSVAGVVDVSLVKSRPRNVTKRPPSRMKKRRDERTAMQSAKPSQFFNDSDASSSSKSTGKAAVVQSEVGGRDPLVDSVAAPQKSEAPGAPEASNTAHQLGNKGVHTESVGSSSSMKSVNPVQPSSYAGASSSKSISRSPSSRGTSPSISASQSPKESPVSSRRIFMGRHVTKSPRTSWESSAYGGDVRKSPRTLRRNSQQAGSAASSPTNRRNSAPVSHPGSGGPSPSSGRKKLPGFTIRENEVLSFNAPYLNEETDVSDYKGKGKAPLHAPFRQVEVRSDKEVLAMPVDSALQGSSSVKIEYKAMGIQQTSPMKVNEGEALPRDIPDVNAITETSSKHVNVTKVLDEEVSKPALSTASRVATEESGKKGQGSEKSRKSQIKSFVPEENFMGHSSKSLFDDSDDDSALFGKKPTSSSAIRQLSGPPPLPGKGSGQGSTKSLFGYSDDSDDSGGGLFSSSANNPLSKKPPPFQVNRKGLFDDSGDET
eukprot:Nk52_evm23s2474 gene=Nk52_evmTU23s2474